MTKYAITMGIRTACVVLCIFVHGWWLLLPAAGAVGLPYVAVVLANVTWLRPSTVLRPGTVVPAATADDEPEMP
jgi:hypothetical protein